MIVNSFYNDKEWSVALLPAIAIEREDNQVAIGVAWGIWAVVITFKV